MTRAALTMRRETNLLTIADLLGGLFCFTETSVRWVRIITRKGMERDGDIATDLALVG